MRYVLGFHYHYFLLNGKWREQLLTKKVSRDLAKTPGFSPTLNWVAVLLVALNPLTKLPLSLRPVRPLKIERRWGSPANN